MNQTGAAIAYDGGDDERVSVEFAYDSVRNALSTLSKSDSRRNFDRYVSLQSALFDLKAALRALDPEFQAMELSGTDLAIPSAAHHIGEYPGTRDEYGEWELPTAYDDFRVLDAVQACRPENPHTTHHVSVDHRVTPGGDVHVEVNGHPLDEIPPDDDSRAPW